MHWIVQDNLFHEAGHQALLGSMERYGLQHTLVQLDGDTLVPEPVIEPGALVYVVGSVKLARLAKLRGWSPGSFNNEYHRFECWRDAWGQDLLNHDSVVQPLIEVRPPAYEFFIRPCADTKAFSGRCFWASEFLAWRDHILESGGEYVDVNLRRHRTGLKPTTLVSWAPLKTIISEFRFFVVDAKAVAGSLYKRAGKWAESPVVDVDAWEFAQRMVKVWQPAPAFVLDVGRTPDGLKVVEVNCINTSGFYSCDVSSIVQAIENLGASTAPGAAIATVS